MNLKPVETISHFEKRWQKTLEDKGIEKNRKKKKHLSSFMPGLKLFYAYSNSKKSKVISRLGQGHLNFLPPRTAVIYREKLPAALSGPHQSELTQSEKSPLHFKLRARTSQLWRVEGCNAFFFFSMAQLLQKYKTSWFRKFNGPVSLVCLKGCRYSSLITSKTSFYK